MSGRTPRVTVAINAYNGARYLAQAVQSVLAQDYDDYELLLYDDCSSDATPEVFAAASEGRGRYVRAPRPLPLNLARHGAMQESRGEWVAFLDQDDVWWPDKLRKQMALVDGASEEVALVYGRGVRFDDAGRVAPFHPRFVEDALPERDVVAAILRFGLFVPMSTAVIRKDAYFALGGVAEDITLAVDDWLFAALATRYAVRALQDVCCWYRVHDTNIHVVESMVCLKETLAVVERFGAALPPRELAWRRKVWETLIGHGLARAGRPLAGLRHVVRHGSLPYLLSRPFARAARWLGGVGRRPRSLENLPPPPGSARSAHG